MYYIILMYGVGLLMEMFAPGFYWRFLSLDAQAILHGQIWRIVTFMIYPPGGGIFGSLISMYLYYMVGNTLERVWGHSGLMCISSWELSAMWRRR